MAVSHMQNHMILLAVVLVILCNVPVGGQLCQGTDVVYFNSKCLQLFKERKSWTDAGNDCKSRNGTLVVIDNKKSDDFVRESYLKRKGLNVDVWIGASATKRWRWDDDGQPLPWAAWGPGEPNFNGGNEDRVMLWRDFDYKWNDEAKTTTHIYRPDESHEEKSNAICEFNNGQSCPGETNCGSGVFYNGSCFCLEVHPGRVSQDGYTWGQANSLCLNRGARLAHIENQSTQNAIVSHIKAESVRDKWRYAGNYWIGAVWDIAEQYNWVWENGMFT
ncbi:macrophage mannose receptor 1-like [Lingula anatina]|uniref:Macrophage mannose receptor 1-like n=1 Tax=Lingula anatina TaxID=7574 RepID=A0A2R2MJE6_LINAN|nr:macrophage mannose receptor 1-like [Lingula anatina]|eukprot:XP_023930341.1 macrophage mannose receptor 1-like [Lingula anatina]